MEADQPPMSGSCIARGVSGWRPTPLLQPKQLCMSVEWSRWSRGPRGSGTSAVDTVQGGRWEGLVNGKSLGLQNSLVDHPRLYLRDGEIARYAQGTELVLGRLAHVAERGEHTQNAACMEEWGRPLVSLQFSSCRVTLRLIGGQGARRLVGAAGTGLGGWIGFRVCGREG